MPARSLLAVVLALTLALVLADDATNAPATPDAPISLVNPFIGTQDFGNTFPGAAVPFGMVQLSPDNGGQAGYDHDNTRIDGFSHTHLSGVGCGALGEVRVMPTTGTDTSTRPSRFGSHYRHDTEVARPGYYAVDLTRYGIRAELTATTRTGWTRMHFPATGEANVLFDVGRAVMPVHASEIAVTGDRTVEGKLQTGGFCGARDRHWAYFSARFDRPFAQSRRWRTGARVTFNTTQERDVELQVGLSYTSVDGARRNLAAEADGQTFDGVVAAAAARWATMLDRARIEGGSADRRIAFTTALYHALLHPNVVGDVDGAYTGADGRVHRATGHTPMGNLSLWDSYRTQNQLLGLLAPDVARDVALSILAAGHEGGRLPRWSLVTSETNVMTGDPVTPFLVENWQAGLLAGHEQEAYALLRANAFGTAARTGNRWYLRRGYIPTGQRCPGDCRRPASATLEYAAADGALSVMADGLGHAGDARALRRRAAGYRTLWDRRRRAFHPRGADGRFLDPYDPTSGAGQFHEGGAYQYQWLVPQDPQGLVDLLGGRAATASRLDAFFAYPRLLRDPAGTARRAWVDHPYDYYRTRTYNPNNEPDLHAPFLYAWAGQPWKTSTVVRAAHTLFTTGPEGMTGNDDLGTMSAWYVLTSLGLYPVAGGGGYFALTTPQFPHASVRLQGGRTLDVDAPGVSDARRYIRTATIGDRAVRRAWLTRDAVLAGGRLRFGVAERPTGWATRAAPPPSLLRRG